MRGRGERGKEGSPAGSGRGTSPLQNKRASSEGWRRARMGFLCQEGRRRGSDHSLKNEARMNVVGS